MMRAVEILLVWARLMVRTGATVCTPIAVVLALWPTAAAAAYSWKREPLLQPSAVKGISSSPSGVLYAMHQFGGVFRYDGVYWNFLASIGGTQGGQCRKMRSVGESGLIVTGDGGRLAYFDGSVWSPVDTGTSFSFYDAWVASPTDVFAVGRSGTVGRFDGTTWHPMRLPDSYYDLTSVWGASPTDVWTAGNQRVLHYDGSTWTRHSETPGCSPQALWGSSAADIFLVGSGGCVFHYDGARWTRMESGTGVILFAVWGSAPDDVYAVGQGGTALHYDGSSWSAIDIGTSSDLLSVHGLSRNNVFIGTADGDILHYRNWPAAATVRLPETGQMTSFGPNDDGALRAGDAVPWDRYTIHWDGTVTDNLTGLMWLQDANLADTLGWIPGYPTNMTMRWHDALAFVQHVNAGRLPGGVGYSDWRLPNVNELQSLRFEGVSCLAWWLGSWGQFQNVQRAYWSSTTVEYGAHWDRAWVVGFGDRGAEYCETRLDQKSKDSLHSVWLVRGTTTGRNRVWRTGATSCYAPTEQWDPECSYDQCRIPCAGTGQDGDLRAGAPWPALRFIDNGNGTVTDMLTGLTWLQDSSCLGSSSWSEGLAAVAALNERPADLACWNYTASHQDWRMPNRIELSSLLDYSRSSPAVLYESSRYFPALGQTGWYWTSTSAPESFGRLARCVDVNTGDVHAFSKDLSWKAWAVRGTSRFSVSQPYLSPAQPEVQLPQTPLVSD